MKTTRLITLILATALLARADVLKPSQDSSSLKGKLTPVTGKATTLAVSATRKGYVLFNLDSLPSDVGAADIANARLRVYFPAAKKPGDISIHTVTTAWIETATAIEPGVSVSPVAVFPTATVVAKKFVEVDVTATVQAWRTTPATNFGFALTATGLTNVLIGAKEGSGSGYPCELDIEIQRTLADGSITGTQLGLNLSLGGTTTGSFSGPLSGNVTGNVSGSAASFTGNLAGDVTGSQDTTVVASVGGSTAANVHAAELLANAATTANTPKTIVKRDASGNLSAGTVTATAFTGDGSGLTGVAAASAPTKNLQQIALLKWGVSSVNNSFDVGATPTAICFDGASIWVANYNSNNVTKLNASTGAVQGTFAVGTQPYGICFDGASIWVANAGSANVTKLNASTGAVQGTFAVGTSPFPICFDGASIWVANSGSDNVTKLNASTGAVQGTFAVGTSPIGICFDGASIWVANSGSNNVTKL